MILACLLGWEVDLRTWDGMGCCMKVCMVGVLSLCVRVVGGGGEGVALV